jgi:hypothetical protein
VKEKIYNFFTSIGFTSCSPESSLRTSFPKQKVDDDRPLLTKTYDISQSTQTPVTLLTKQFIFMGELLFTIDDQFLEFEKSKAELGTTINQISKNTTIKASEEASFADPFQELKQRTSEALYYSLVLKNNLATLESNLKTAYWELLQVKPDKLLINKIVGRFYNRLIFFEERPQSAILQLIGGMAKKFKDNCAIIEKLRLGEEAELDFSTLKFTPDPKVFDIEGLCKEVLKQAPGDEATKLAVQKLYTALVKDIQKVVDTFYIDYQKGYEPEGGLTKAQEEIAKAIKLEDVLRETLSEKNALPTNTPQLKESPTSSAIAAAAAASYSGSEEETVDAPLETTQVLVTEEQPGY